MTPDDLDALIARMRTRATDWPLDEREPEPPAPWDEERGIERMEDAYEKEMDARWE